jgi:hypothetical protein
MTRLEIATLACKILGLWLFAQTVLLAITFLLGVIGVLGSFINENAHLWVQVSSVAATGLILVAYFATSWWIWVKAPQIAKHMVSADQSPVTSLAMTQQDVMTIAFPIAGVCLFLPPARELSRIFVEVFFQSSRFSAFWSSVEWHARFWSAVLEMALALWLIFGARGIVRLILSMRRPDVQPDGASDKDHVL